MLYLILKTVEADSLVEAIKREAKATIVKVEEATEQKDAPSIIGFNH